MSSMGKLCDALWNVRAMALVPQTPNRPRSHEEGVRAVASHCQAATDQVE